MSAVIAVPSTDLSLFFFCVFKSIPSASMIHQETVPVSEAEVVALWKHCLEVLSDGALKLRRQVE